MTKVKWKDGIMDTRTDLDARNKVWDMIKNIKVALMVTQDELGMLRSRPMAAQQDRFEGQLWFFTKAGSSKTDDIRADSSVLLAYADPGANAYVSVLGDAEILNDREKIREMWSEMLRIWFPKGPDDETIRLIKVDVAGAEYWDSTSSTMMLAYGYVKARLTGATPKVGENAKVAFDT
jgi:general stress protein 26